MAVRFIARIIDWPLLKLQKWIWRMSKPNTSQEIFYLSDMSFKVLKFRLKIFNYFH